MRYELYTFSMATVKKTLKLEGLDCVSCAVMIDDVLEELPGVVSSKTNYPKSVCEVELDEDKTSLEDVISSIEMGGFTASAPKES